MPLPIIGRAATVLAEVDAPDRRVTVRVFTWIDIVHPIRPAAATDAAAILGRLHALAYPAAGPPDSWFTEPVAATRWRELVTRAELAAAPWAPTLAALVPTLVTGESIIAEGHHHPTIRCHRDFNPENVALDAAGRPVVVDWENSGPAAAEQELASVLAEFVPDPRGVPAFLAAYEAGGGTATLRDPSSFAMTLAFQSNLVAWYAERALDPGVADEDRARSVHWFIDIAEHAFTPARIDAWLAAASATAGPTGRGA
jgi:Ser/Thr protein kinase RdoA (MazF antagonist)